MSRIICAFLFLLLIIPFAMAEEIYKTVDENGKVIYTDTPTKEGEKVEMQELNTVPPPEYRPRPSSSSSEGGSSMDGPPNYQLYFSSPADGTKVGPEQTSLNVQVQVEPGLQSGHLLQFFVNGQPQGTAQSSTSFVATNLMRGQKTIGVAIVDQQGNVLASAAPVRVYVIRPNPKAK